MVRLRTSKPVHLWTNYSSHVLTPAQTRYLNLGLNFVHLPQKFNRTEVEASLMQWERSMRWREYWYSVEQKDTLEEANSDGSFSEDDQVNTERIFQDKSKKTNLPRNHSVPAALTA